MSETINAIYINNPFDVSDHQRHALAYASDRPLSEYLGSFADEDHVVSVSGALIEREHYAQYIPHADDTIVVCPIPRGGGGGAKNIMRMVALVALSYFTLGAGAPALLAAQPALGMAAFIAGSMLINALLPMQNLSQENSGLNDSPSYGIDGAKNTIEEGRPVPLCYGQFRCGGNVVGLYTENIENTQHLYMLINAGEGPIAGISAIEINDQPAENFQDVETRVRLGTSDQPVIEWFNDIISPHNVGVTLSETPAVYSTSDEIDKFRIDLVFPIGLFKVDNDNGKTKPWTVEFIVEYRKQGDVSWTAMDSAKNISSSTEIYVYSAYDVYDDDGNYVSTVPERRETELDPGTTVSNGLIYGGEIVIGYVDYEYTYDALLAVTDAQRSPLRVSFESPQLAQDYYDIRVKRTTAQSEAENIIDQVVWADLNEIKIADVSYKYSALCALKIRLSDQLNGLPNVTYMHGGRNIRYWASGAMEWRNGPSDNPAWIVWDMLTNARYSGGIDPGQLDLHKWREWGIFCDANNLTFNGTFDTNSNIWDAVQYVLSAGQAQLVRVGTRYTIAIEREDEPVMMFSQANIIKGSFKRSWLPLDQRANEIEVSYFDKDDKYKRRAIKVYDENLLNLPQRTSSITLHGVVDAQQAWERANLHLNMNRLIHETVSFDAPLEAIAATVGDLILVKEDLPTWGFSGRLKAGSTDTLLKLDSTVNLAADSNFVALIHLDKVVVLQSAVSAVSADYVGVIGYSTSSDPVNRLLRFNTGKDYPVHSIDYHDITTGWSLAVPEAIADGLSASEPVVLYRTDVVEERAISTTGPATEVTISPALPSTPAEGAHWMIGETGVATKTYRVVEVSGDSTLKRSLTAIEYDPDVYNFAGTVVPPPTSPVAAVEHVINLALYEDFIQEGDTLVPRLTVTWEPYETGFGYKGADVYLSISSAPFEFQASVTDGIYKFSTSEPDLGDEVTFRVVAFDWDERRASILTAPTISKTVTGNGDAPLPAIGLTLEPGYFDILVKWSLDAAAFDAKTIEIWADMVTGLGNPAQMVQVGVEAAEVGEWLHTGLNPGATVCYWIRVINTSGVAGAWYPADLDDPDLPGTGVCATCKTDINTYIDDITRDQLDPWLRKPIDMIDTQEALWDKVERAYELLDALGEAVALSATNADEVYAQQIGKLNDYKDVVNTALAGIDVGYNEEIQQLITDLSAEITARETLAVQVGDNQAAILNEQTVRADADVAMASSITILDARVDDNEAAIVTEQTARADADTALSSTITILDARVDDNEAAIVVEQTARADGDSANASLITTLTSTVNDNTAAILTEQTTRADADSALANDISVLTASVGDNEAAILTEQTARANADSAIASNLSALTTDVEGNTAAIIAEETARSTADSAMASSISVLTSTVNSNTSLILTEQTTRASGDSALASQITTLNAQVGSNQAAIANEATVRASVDSALSTNINALGARMDDAEASIISEHTAWVAGDQANAVSIDQVDTTVKGHTATILEHAESIDGIFGRYGVKIDVDGNVAGFELLNGLGLESQFAVYADRFYVANPSAPASLQAPFTVVNGQVLIQQALIGEAWIDTLHVTGMAITEHATASNQDGVLITNPNGTVYKTITTGLNIAAAIDGGPYPVTVIATAEVKANYCDGVQWKLVGPTIVPGVENVIAQGELDVPENNECFDPDGWGVDFDIKNIVAQTVDTPPAGGYALYKFVVLILSGAGAAISNISITVMAAKR